MLISDSMPLLWLSYVALSLVVVVTGCLAIRWLPRLPRFVVTGLVAGLLWMPAGFTLPQIEGNAAYAGLAPAVVVASIAYLQGNGNALGGALAWLLLGAGLGVVAGILAWLGLRRRDGKHNARDGATTADARREPVIG